MTVNKQSFPKLCCQYIVPRFWILYQIIYEFIFYVSIGNGATICLMRKQVMFARVVYSLQLVIIVHYKYNQLDSRNLFVIPLLIGQERDVP